VRRHQATHIIPRLHDEAGSSSQLHRVNGVLEAYVSDSINSISCGLVVHNELCDLLIVVQLAMDFLWICCATSCVFQLVVKLAVLLQLVVDFCCGLAVGFRFVVHLSYSMLYNKSTTNRSNGVQH